MEIWFDNISSLRDYNLEMEYCYITTPKRKRNLIDVPAADGDIDVMEGIGEPTYENRTVTALFKMLGNIKATRYRIINNLEGKTVQIVLPGDPNHYMVGRVHVAGLGFSPGDELLIIIDCNPWRYARSMVSTSIAASASEGQHTWRNSGRRLAVPEITVESGDVTFVADGKTTVLGQGTHLVTALAIPGFSSRRVTARGGAFSVQYREAIL